MALAGVLDLADHPVDALAGGERQRALLARALAQEPRVLLLDEPTSHLDLWHQRHLVGLLRRLNRERGMTVVFVSHDLNLAGDLAHRLLLLSGGRVCGWAPRGRSWTRRCSRWPTAARSGWSGSRPPAAPSSSGSDFDFSTIQRDGDGKCLKSKSDPVRGGERASDLRKRPDAGKPVRRPEDAESGTVPQL